MLPLISPVTSHHTAYLTPEPEDDWIKDSLLIPCTLVIYTVPVRRSVSHCAAAALPRQVGPSGP